MISREFKSPHERAHYEASDSLARKVFEIIATDNHSLRVDLVEDPKDPDDPTMRRVQASAREHLGKIDLFHRKHFDSISPRPLQAGVHGVLYKQDVMTHEALMLAASNIVTLQDRMVRHIQVAIKDGDLTKNNTVTISDDGTYDTYTKLRLTNARLIHEVLLIVGEPNRSLLDPITTGHVEFDDIAKQLLELESLIAEKCDPTETSRLIDELTRQYLDRKKAKQLEDKLKQPTNLTVDELKDLNASISDAEKWS